MTHETFIALQRGVYYTQPMDKEWDKLFAQYNQANGTSLNRISRNDHITILVAIAKKQGFEFNPVDVEKFSPIKKML